MSSTINSKIDALFSKLKNKEPIKSKFETQVENLTLLKKNTKAVEAIEKFIIEKALSCTQHRKSNPNNARIANMYRDLFKEFFTLCDLLESTHNADRETLKLYFSLDKKLYSQLRRYQRYSLETFPALNIRDLSIEDLRHYPILDGSLITDIFNSYPEAMKEFMKDYIHIMPNSVVKYVKNKEKEKPSTPAESYINNKITNDFEFKTFLNNLDDKFKIKRCEKAFFEFDYLENGEALLRNRRVNP